MVTVKFFGLIRIKTGISEMQAEGKNLKEVFRSIEKKNPSLTVKDLKRKVIFINGVNITDLKVFRTKVEEGDEIIIMSPVSGG